MPRQSTPSRVLVALLVAGAVVLSLRGTTLAQQGPQLISLLVSELPTDPTGAVWRQAPAANVPLTPQAAALPRLMQVTVPTVSVRSVNDGQHVAFLLEWADATRDAWATRPDEFRDAAAIMFPVGDFLPNICMGSPGQLANLWHWKADWQEDIDNGFQDVVDAYPNFYKDHYPFVDGQPPFRFPTDFGSAEAGQYFIALAANNPLARPDRSSPIEELVSVGFGTVTHKAGQEVQGKGVWADGRWRVMFLRSLQPSDTSAANLAGRTEVPISLAVWNGSNQEVGARKQLSSFVTVQIGGRKPAATPGLQGADPGWAWVAPLFAGVLLMAALLVLGYRTREREVRHDQPSRA